MMAHIPDRHELAKRIKHEAQNLGFALLGITSPDPPAHLDIYSQWLHAGMHGDMTYLATERNRERRSDPRNILPDCQSILVAAINCLPRSKPEELTPTARVAAYAQGDDYHQVFNERLEKLVVFIKMQIKTAFSYKIYSDTGPILEREFAQRAGLGWIGKNTCLINPRLGSHFLIGEVLLSIPLVFDTPFVSDHCGSCTRCIDSCPTSCILPNRTIDARRCISYLTIEQRGEIAHEFRPLMNNWIFGCDVCQDVCPWNIRFAQPTQDIAFQPRSILDQPSLEDFLALSDDEFRALFKNSALKRPKRAGLLRNALIAAGNSKREDLIPMLEKLLLNEETSQVRSHAVWALLQIRGNQAKRALQNTSKSIQDPTILDEIQEALANWRTNGDVMQ